MSNAGKQTSNRKASGAGFTAAPRAAFSRARAPHAKTRARLFVCALLFLTSALATGALGQDAGRRSARSLTSEDLLNRPVIYVPQPAMTSSSSPSPGAARSAGGTFYRDPAGAFTLNFPNGSWRVNPRGASAGRIYNQRSFRRIESEGFASATANVYVLTDAGNLPQPDASHMNADSQREIASALASRFLSSNATVVSVEPVAAGGGRAGLRIIADQTIARRVAVRAYINVFERNGRLYVAVFCASPETFDATAHEFEVISNSLASSVARS